MWMFRCFNRAAALSKNIKLCHIERADNTPKMIFRRLVYQFVNGSQVCQVRYFHRKHFLCQHTAKGWKVLANPNLQENEISDLDCETWACEEGTDAIPHRLLLSQLDSCSSLEEQMEALCSNLGLSTEDIAKRQEFCDYLSNIFEPYFNSFKIQKFGSSANNFGFKGSDIDVSFLLNPDRDASKPIEYVKALIPTPDDILNGSVDKSIFDDLNPKLLMRFIRRMIRKNCTDIKEPIILIKARCPLLRFYHETYDLFCDFSVGNGTALQNTKLLRFVSHMDERVVILVRILRYWGKRGKFVGDLDRFNSYAFSLIVVYFLQNTSPAIIPPLNEILAKSEYLKTGHLNDDELMFRSLKDFPRSQNRQKPVELLREFFSFYTYFDFKRVLLPLTSLSVPIADFNSGQDPPTEVFERGTICMQDPFRYSFNTTASLVYSNGRRFLCSLIEASKIFQDPDTYVPSSSRHWGLSALFESTRRATPDTSLYSETLDSITISLKPEVERSPTADPNNKQGNREQFLQKTAGLVRKLFEHSLLFRVVVKNYYNHEHDPQLKFYLEALHHTSVGRDCIMRERFAGAVVDNPLELERSISLDLIQDCTNKQVLYTFECQCALSEDQTCPAVDVKLTLVSGKCNNAVPLFLKEYVPKVLKTLL